jgi:hypothetical protein
MASHGALTWPGPPMVEHACVVGVPDTLDMLQALHTAALAVEDEESAEAFAPRPILEGLSTNLDDKQRAMVHWLASCDPLGMVQPKPDGWEGDWPPTAADLVKAAASLSPTAAVLERFPDPDRPFEEAQAWPKGLVGTRMEFPHSLATFCLPGGAEVAVAPRQPPTDSQEQDQPALSALLSASLAEEDARPRVFSFALTAEDGSRAFGHVLALWQPLVGAPGLVAQRALCLLSRRPLVAPLRSLLAALAVQLSKGQVPAPALRALLLTLMSTPGKPRIGQTMNLTFSHPECPLGVQVSVRRPSFDVLPTADSAGFRALLGRLGPEGAVRLWHAAILEQRILMHSTDVDCLVPTSSALTSLLFPLAWPHPCVPLLPLSLLRFLSAPVPYIMGIESEALGTRSTLEALPRAWLVSLDLGPEAGASSIIPPSAPEVPGALVCEGETAPGPWTMQGLWGHSASKLPAYMWEADTDVSTESDSDLEGAAPSDRTITRSTSAPSPERRQLGLTPPPLSGGLPPLPSDIEMRLIARLAMCEDIAEDPPSDGEVSPTWSHLALGSRGGGSSRDSCRMLQGSIRRGVTPDAEATVQATTQSIGALQVRCAFTEALACLLAGFPRCLAVRAVGVVDDAVDGAGLASRVQDRYNKPSGIARQFSSPPLGTPQEEWWSCGGVVTEAAGWAESPGCAPPHLRVAAQAAAASRRLKRLDRRKRLTVQPDRDKPPSTPPKRNSMGLGAAARWFQNLRSKPSASTAAPPKATPTPPISPPPPEAESSPIVYMPSSKRRSITPRRRRHMTPFLASGLSRHEGMCPVAASTVEADRFTVVSPVGAIAPSAMDLGGFVVLDVVFARRRFLLSKPKEWRPLLASLLATQAFAALLEDAVAASDEAAAAAVTAIAAASARDDSDGPAAALSPIRVGALSRDMQRTHPAPPPSVGFAPPPPGGWPVKPPARKRARRDALGSEWAITLKRLVQASSRTPAVPGADGDAPHAHGGLFLDELPWANSDAAEVRLFLWCCRLAELGPGRCLTLSENLRRRCSAAEDGLIPDPRIHSEVDVARSLLSVIAGAPSDPFEGLTVPVGTSDALATERAVAGELVLDDVRVDLWDRMQHPSQEGVRPIDAGVWKPIHLGVPHIPSISLAATTDAPVEISGLPSPEEPERPSSVGVVEAERPATPSSGLARPRSGTAFPSLGSSKPQPPPDTHSSPEGSIQSAQEGTPEHRLSLPGRQRERMAEEEIAQRWLSGHLHSSKVRQRVGSVSARRRATLLTADALAAAIREAPRHRSRASSNSDTPLEAADIAVAASRRDSGVASAGGRRGRASTWLGRVQGVASRSELLGGMLVVEEEEDDDGLEHIEEEEGDSDTDEEGPSPPPAQTRRSFREIAPPPPPRHPSSTTLPVTPPPLPSSPSRRSLPQAPPRSPAPPPPPPPQARPSRRASAAVAAVVAAQLLAKHGIKQEQLVGLQTLGRIESDDESDDDDKGAAAAAASRSPPRRKSSVKLVPIPAAPTTPPPERSSRKGSSVMSRLGGFGALGRLLQRTKTPPRTDTPPASKPASTNSSHGGKPACDSSVAEAEAKDEALPVEAFLTPGASE